MPKLAPWPTCSTTARPRLGWTIIGIVPDPPALSRLAGAVLVEPLDEWQASDRHDMSEACMATLFTAPTPLPTRPDEAPLPELAVA